MVWTLTQPISFNSTFSFFCFPNVCLKLFKIYGREDLGMACPRVFPWLLCLHPSILYESKGEVQVTWRFTKIVPKTLETKPNTTQKQTIWLLNFFCLNKVIAKLKETPRDVLGWPILQQKNKAYLLYIKASVVELITPSLLTRRV